MSQTSVVEQAAAFAGMKADSRYDLVSSVVAEGAIGFGKYVARGTDAEKQGVLPSSAGQITDVKLGHGIAIQSHAMEQTSAVDPQYDDKKMMSVMRRGACYVKVEEAVTVASDVYVRFAAGGDGLGSFRGSDPGSEAAIMPNAKYIKGADAGGFAIVEFSLEG